MEIKINKGLINSMEAIDIRKAVFVDEQHFIDEFDDIDDIAYHALIFDNDIPVATGRLFQTEDMSYHIGRVAVIKEYRGKGIGALLMKKLEEKAAELGATETELSAQTRAADFYKNIGYSPVGEEYLDQYCPHIKMLKKV